MGLSRSIWDTMFNEKTQDLLNKRLRTQWSMELKDFERNICRIRINRSDAKRIRKQLETDNMITVCKNGQHGHIVKIRGDK